MSKRWMQVISIFCATMIVSILVAFFVVYSEKDDLYGEQMEVIGEFKERVYTFSPNQPKKYPYTIHFQEDWSQLDGRTKEFKISEEVDRVMGELSRQWDVKATEKLVAINVFEKMTDEWIENNQTSEFKSIKIRPIFSTKDEMSFAYELIFALKNETNIKNQKTHGEITMVQTEKGWKIKSDKTLGKNEEN